MLQQVETGIFPANRCYKPRRLESYVYAPRTKRPPNWQAAQRFVKALVVARIGHAPYIRYVPYIQRFDGDFWKYRNAYKKLRNAYEAEDFPINP